MLFIRLRGHHSPSLSHYFQNLAFAICLGLLSQAIAFLRKLAILRSFPDIALMFPCKINALIKRAVPNEMCVMMLEQKNIKCAFACKLGISTTKLGSVFAI